MEIKWKHEVKSIDSPTPRNLLDILLKHRKIENLEEFLHPANPVLTTLEDLDKPKNAYIKMWKKSVTLFEDIKKNNGMIVVYSDYDADGITGGAILWETLHLMGFNVMPYVPDRKTEGYGFSKKGIDTIKRKYNPSLIVSVDHGITAAEKITYAKKIGIPVIVTDHHLKPEKLPDDAVAIYHIPALSGSGVAYYFAKELFSHFKKESWVKNRREIEDHFQKDYLFLASIGTVADLVPLVGPARNLVYHGLKTAHKTERRGLIHIFKQAGIEGKMITPYEIGFIIAPRINAIGRLEHAIDALRLLCTTDDKRAFELAGKIGNKNKERQDLVVEAVDEANALMVRNFEVKHADLRSSTGAEASEKTKDFFALETSSKMRVNLKLPKLIILTSDHWNEGIIGLIASRLVEKYYRPTIILTKSDGFYKGSARSIASFHLTKFLRELKEHLIDVGGHAGAAGFTIEAKKMDKFIRAAEKKADGLISDKDLERTVEADLKIPLHYATLTLAKLIETLKPFGIGNAQPVFYSEVELIDAKLLGKTKTHLKLFIKDPLKNGFPLELIYFGKGELFKELSRGMKMKIVYSVDINRWNGKEQLNGIVKYIL